MAVAKYRLNSIEEPVKGMKAFRLEPLEGGVLKFLPGQFVFLHLLDEGGKSVLKRPYSIASSPSSKYLELIIRFTGGEMTSVLWKMEKGSVLGVEGPFGAFAYTGQKKAAFIGGGCGVTPFMGILRHIAENGIEGRFVLFYSARTRDDIVNMEELAKLEKANPSIKVVVTLTREAPEGWKGETGRVDGGMIKRHAGDAKEYDWWMCGPRAMVMEMRKSLLELGADAKRIKVEGWG